jgi:signal transduction histidine kinase
MRSAVEESPVQSKRAGAPEGRELTQLQARIDEARALLVRLEHQAVEFEEEHQRQEAAGLVEANEHLVLAFLRAQTDAETAARDIAHRMLAAELRLESQRLGEENRQIKEASRLKGEFLANVSHELRTPLNAIIGFSELLRLSATPTSPPNLEYLGHIYDSGENLLNLINSLLDLAKVGAGKLEFHPEPVKLTQAVEEVVDLLQPAIHRNFVVIRTQIDSNINDVVIDKARLKQALSNYLTNAIKFSRRGGIVTVRGLAVGDDCFRLEVEDSGIGISPANQARLFVNFVQIDGSSARNPDGTGLGLALTRSLVEAQGGSVGVRSAFGVGSVFHFVLKRNAIMADPTAGATPAPEGATAPDPGQL